MAPRLGVRNVAWSLLGLSAPAVAALLAIPVLLRTAGPERFGLLALAWAIYSQQGLLDLGLARGLTRRLAGLEGGERSAVVGVALREGARVGAFSGALLTVFTLALFWVGQFSDSISRLETLGTAAIVGVTAIVQVRIAIFRGVLEAAGLFSTLAIRRTVGSSLNFVLPMLCALTVSSRLDVLTLSVLAAKAVHLALLWRGAQPVREALPNESDMEAARIGLRDVRVFGRWFALGSLVSAGLNQSERIAVAILISGVAMGTFSVPLEPVGQVLLAVTAISTVAFPAIAGQAGSQSTETKRTVNRLLLVTAALGLGASVLVAVGFPSLAGWWLGRPLMDVERDIAIIFAFGLTPRALSVSSFAILHGYGMSRQTTQWRAAHAVLHVFLLWALVERSGLTGAATAWSLRLAIDGIYLTALSLRVVGRSSRATLVAEHQ